VNTLLGFCAAHGINGIQERMYNHTQKSELDGLEAALDFDLRKWWQPDAESYFGKLTIAQIGKAYEEAGLSARAGDCEAQAPRCGEGRRAGSECSGLAA
jgi:ParB family chromosome partitioning protein